MANIVSPIFTLVDTVMWSCTQIVYGVIYIFNINIQLVSVTLLGLEFVFHQLVSALCMIGFALASVLQSLVYGATGFANLMCSLADGSALVLYYTQDSVRVLFTWLIFLVPNTLQTILALAVWIQQTIVFVAYNILPLLEQAGTFVVAGLKSLISYSANFTVLVAMSITTLFTLLIHGLYKLFALTVYTVYSALNETYQFVIGNSPGGSSRTQETDEKPWPKRDESENTFWKFHLKGVKEPLTIYDSLQESVSQFVFQILEVMSYLAICIAIICAVIAVVTLLYCLYSNAMSSVNALVTLFHRSLFRSERSIIMDHSVPGPQAIPVQADVPGHLRRNPVLDDLSDAESDDSIHVPRLGQATPIPVLGDVAGPSGNRQPSVPRSRTPRPKSRASDLSSLSRSTTPGSPGGLARDLRRQLEEERDRKLCVVCQDNDKNILIFPCKHLCVCIECVEEIANSSVDRRKCPLCRGRISSYLEVYA